MIAGKLSRRKLLRTSALAGLGVVSTFYGPWRHNRVYAQATDKPIVLGLTSDASGLIPLIAARGATMLMVVAVSLMGLWAVVGFAKAPRRIVIGNGLLDVAGNVALLAALRAGSLARVSIAASFYPAVTVLMARVFNFEHLRTRQVVGLAFTLLALAAIAVG